MIARAKRTHAQLLLLRAELRQRVVSATKLKRTQALKVFTFEKQLPAREGIGRARSHYRRVMCYARNACSSLCDVLVVDR